MIGLLLLCFLVALRLNDPQFLQNIRNQAFDFYQQLKPRTAANIPVTIVDLDERSIEAYGQWPWPRTTIAKLIKGLNEMGASVIGFDIVFAEADRLSPALIAADNPDLPNNIRFALGKLPANDAIMASEMRKGKVVLGQTSARLHTDQKTEIRAAKDVPNARLGADPLPFLADYPALVQNMSVLEDSAAGRGVFTLSPDPDKIFRRIPLLISAGGTLRLHLSAEMLRIADGGENIFIRSNAAGIESVAIGDKAIETNRSAEVWPYFRPFDAEELVSAKLILDGDRESVESRIKDHVVLVGTSLVGLEDIRAIPLGISVPGVTIHGQMIENIVAEQFLVRKAYAKDIEWIAVVVIGLLIIWFVPLTSAITSFVSASILITSTVIVSWWLFASERILVDATWPVASFAALFVVAATANYIREERQRQRIRGAFGQYISPALVDQLSEDPDRLVLGGETRELSVLFTDVRGFTTISESYKHYPQGLTQLMNRFLSVLSQPILDSNGTIDKYMGDAIMAFWNAPVDEPDHAYKACKTALEMLENVDQLNKRRKAELENSEDETYHAINVGVGINSGTCVVGNMGSHNRFDYTALGDTVNLASRLEGQSKPYGVPVVIGSTTADAVKDQLATYEIDLIRVKGKNEPAKIYALAGDEALLANEDFVAFKALNQSMISSYRNQDWQSAFDALDMLGILGDKLGLTLQDYLFIYETRIAEFRNNPPGSNWDGVYTATAK